MAVEQFANRPVTIITAGGTSAPAPGTAETWTALSSSGWPAAATGISQFHVADNNAPTEIITVTNISGTTWSVIRGAEGTAPVTHQAGFPVSQTVTAGGLGQLRVTDWLNVATMFGADPSGATDSTAAIGSAVAAAGSLQPVYFPAGTYLISSALNWKIPGLTVIGDSSAAVTISQAAGNTPILQVAGQGQRISGLTLKYASQQPSSSTSAIAVEFGDDAIGSCFESAFGDLYIQLAATAMAVNPAVTTAAGLFSCSFRDIHVLGYSISAISFTGSNGGGANCTGCVFSNIYVHNNFTGSDAASTSYPVAFTGWDELVIDQLNVEHAEIFSSGAVLFAHTGNAVVSSLHLEHLEMSGNPGFGLIGVGTGTGTVQVNGLSVRFCTFTGTSLNSVFRITGGSGQSIILNGLNFPASDGGDTAGTIAIADFNSAASAVAQVTGINGTAAQLWTEYTANPGAGCSAVITGGSQVTYSPALAWTTFATGGMGNGLNSSSGTALTPVAGEWYYADLLIPFTCTITGLIAEAPAGPNSGTDKWIAAIWPGAGGTALAGSAAAGLTVPGSGTTAGNFRIAFTAPVTLAGPAVYKAAVQSNGTAAKIGTFGNSAEGFVTGEQAGTFGTIPSLAPGSTYTQNFGPLLKTY